MAQTLEDMTCQGSVSAPDLQAANNPGQSLDGGQGNEGSTNPYADDPIPQAS
jgi:hypothetical protein